MAGQSNQVRFIYKALVTKSFVKDLCFKENKGHTNMFKQRPIKDQTKNTHKLQRLYVNMFARQLVYDNISTMKESSHED